MTLLVFLVEDDPAIRANLVEAMSGLLDVCFVGHARANPKPFNGWPATRANGTWPSSISSSSKALDSQ